MHAFTIVARNYMAMARVLARSFIDFHPDGRFTIAVIDDRIGSFASDDGRVRCMNLEGLGLPDDLVHRMAIEYDVMEFATGIKPFIMRALLGDSDHIVYFDPDIQIFHDLSPIVEACRREGIVLTPHLLEAPTLDFSWFFERQLLIAGTFNLGFIGVGERSRAFLDWWCSRLARYSRNDQVSGFFVDQKWINLVPAFFEYFVLRDPGYNVAYWNLPQRTVSVRADGSFDVDGRPLQFFHFSGYDPDRPWLLSKYQGQRPRVLLSESPGVAALCRQYRGLLEKHGHASHRNTPYGWLDLPNGLRVDDRMRRVYRKGGDLAEENGNAYPPDPFDPDQSATAVAWLRDPSTATSAVGRYLTDVWQTTPEIHARFPSVDGPPGEAFASWVRRNGHQILRIPAEFVPSSDRSRIAARVTDRHRSGINVVGYFRAESGVGEAGRLLATAVAASGLPHSVTTYSNVPQKDLVEFADVGSIEYDTNLICVNADQVPVLHHHFGPRLFDGRYTVGHWYWEVDPLPESQVTALSHIDELWVASGYLRDVFTRRTSKPVLVIPLPVVLPSRPFDMRTKATTPFEFLFIFDFFSVLERKNPMGLITAFKRAFPSGAERVTLTIKSINGDRIPTALERLRFAAGDDPRIEVRDGYVSDGERLKMIVNAGCYISLHRSEGFGFTMAEAMALGRPVIATRHSGNLQYMNERNSFLVDAKLVAVPAGVEAYPRGAIWADPDLDHAASLMRLVTEKPEEANRRAQRGIDFMKTHHSLSATTTFIQRQFAELQRRHRARAAPTQNEGGSKTREIRAKLAIQAVRSRPGRKAIALVRGAMRRDLEKVEKLVAVSAANVDQMADELAVQRRYAEALEQRLMLLEGDGSQAAETRAREEHPPAQDPVGLKRGSARKSLR